MRLRDDVNALTRMLRASDKEVSTKHDERRRPTYSLGNSPRANEQRREVFPQAPVQGSVKCKDTTSRLHAVANNDQFPSNLELG